MCRNRERESKRIKLRRIIGNIIHDDRGYEKGKITYEDQEQEGREQDRMMGIDSVTRKKMNANEESIRDLWIILGGRKEGCVVELDDIDIQSIENAIKQLENIENCPS